MRPIHTLPPTAAPHPHPALHPKVDTPGHLNRALLLGLSGRLLPRPPPARPAHRPTPSADPGSTTPLPPLPEETALPRAAPHQNTHYNAVVVRGAHPQAKLRPNHRARLAVRPETPHPQPTIPPHSSSQPITLPVANSAGPSASHPRRQHLTPFLVPSLLGPSLLSRKTPVHPPPPATSGTHTSPTLTSLLNRSPPPRTTAPARRAPPATRLQSSPPDPPTAAIGSQPLPTPPCSGYARDEPPTRQSPHMHPAIQRRHERLAQLAAASSRRTATPSTTRMEAAQNASKPPRGQADPTGRPTGHPIRPTSRCPECQVRFPTSPQRASLMPTRHAMPRTPVDTQQSAAILSDQSRGQPLRATHGRTRRLAVTTRPE